VHELLVMRTMNRALIAAALLLAACSSETSTSSTSLTREPGECSDVEVHVIGVSDGGDTGAGTVILARPGHHILVLSSFAQMHWTVDVKPDAVLDEVYAVGHYTQSVSTNVTTKVMTESAVSGGADANGYQYPDKNAVALMKLAALRVARHPTSFHGCFSASHWTIGENMAVTSDCATAAYTQYDAVIDCDGDNECGGGGSGDGDGDGGGGGGGGGSGGGDGSLY
jgi:uncharacterized membrane protein YgcG